MSKGHRPGQKITRRSMKVLPPAFRCEIREQYVAAYENSAIGSAKRLNIFKSLDAHERKHGCGKKLACQQLRRSE